MIIFTYVFLFIYFAQTIRTFGLPSCHDDIHISFLFSFHSVHIWIRLTYILVANRYMLVWQEVLYDILSIFLCWLVADCFCYISNFKCPCHVNGLPKKKKSGQVRIIFLKCQHKDQTNRNNYLTSGYRNMPQ